MYDSIFRACTRLYILTRRIVFYFVSRKTKKSFLEIDEFRFPPQSFDVIAFMFKFGGFQFVLKTYVSSTVIRGSELSRLKT